MAPLTPGFSGVALGISALAFFITPQAGVDPIPQGEDLALAMHLDLLEDFSLLSELENVEAYEVLAQVSLADMEQLAAVKSDAQ
ncbi:MAG: hypothetical protein R3C68_04915 [Myxococcota bacterium]